MSKKIWVITLFPEFFKPLIECGIGGQALRGERGKKIELITVQLRDFAKGDYKGVDDTPYGGGPGMVIRPDVLKSALLDGVVGPGGYGEDYRNKLWIIYPGPRGHRWNDVLCREFAKKFECENDPTGPGRDIVFICGRYEGVDERFLNLYVDEEISLGDFVLTGGEIPTMAIIDSFLRFVGGVLGNALSGESESFGQGMIEHPQYTRPQIFEGVPVPDILLSGHHKKIEEYRSKESLQTTLKWRPDLLKK